MLARILTALALLAVVLVSTGAASHAARMDAGSQHVLHADEMLPAGVVGEHGCPEGHECTEAAACANNYPLSDSVRSVAYTFNLVCDRKRYLKVAFDAFLYGGFIGSLYYGEII